MKTKTTDPNRETLSGLARLVQADRKTVRAHLGHDGAPARGRDGCYDRAAAVRFLRAGIGKGAASLSLLEELRTKRLQLEIERVTFELSVQKRDFIPLASLAPQARALVDEIAGLMRQKFEMELPARYAGKSLVECSLINAEAIDEIGKRFKAGVRPLTQ
jgi:hypothetical protein